MLRKIALVLFAILFSGFALCQIPNAKEVLVQEKGTWQWGVSPFASYPLTKMNSPDGVPLYVISRDFQLQRDEPEENNITFTHLGVSTYKIELKSDQRGSRHVRFYAYKNGSQCKTSDGVDYKYVELSNFSNTYVDAFAKNCGIVFYAEWETLAIETDVEIHNLGITEEEYRANISARLKEITDSGTSEVINKLNNLSKEIRVLDLRVHFVLDKSGNKFIVAGPYNMNEGDWWDSTRNRTIFITDNGKLLYMIMLKSKLTNEFYVAKVKDSFKGKKIYDVTAGKSGKAAWDALQAWEGWSEGMDYSKDSELWERAKAAGGATATGLATGTATVAGLVAYDLGVTSGATVAGSLSFLGSTASLTSSFGGATGILAATPPGWIIIGGAAVGLAIGGTAYYFTETDNYFYDNGNLILNWDSQLLTTAAEAKINYIMVQNPDMPIAEISNQEDATATENCSVRIKFNDLGVLKEKTKDETNSDGEKGFGIKDIFNGAYLVESNTAIKKGPKEIVENDSIRFENLSCGTNYELWIKFSGYKPLKYKEFTTEGAS